MKEFELLGWLVEPKSLKVSRNGDHHRLANKAMQLLCFLAEHQGSVVTHEEIEQHVWDGNSFVAKKAATNTIWQLRKLFQPGDDASEFIETIPKRGYRLNATVEFVSRNRRGRLNSISTKSALFAAFVTIAALVAVVIHFSVFSTPKWQPTIFTDFPGEETEPALSADGQKLAFIWSGRGRQPDVYWKYSSTRGEAPFRLTDTVADEAMPTWSPDGSHVAFIRIQPETRDCTVHIVSPATKVEWYVTECQATIPGTLAWSPDGKWLAYSYKGDNKHGIGVVKPDGTDPRQLSTSPNYDMVDTSVTWAPDSLSLAFTRRTSVEVDEIHITDLGGNSRQLVDAPTNLFGLTWSAYADELIVAATPEGEHRRQLLRIDTETGAFLGKLEQGALEAYVPHMALNGRTIAYDASNFVVSVGTLGEQGERVDAIPAIASLSTDREPTVSVNGQIAFTSTRSGSKEIWLYEDGSELPKPVTSFNTMNVFGPAWSPDGRHIAFLAPGGAENKLQIYLLEAASKTLSQLTNSATDHMPPSWAPDGKSILAAEREEGQAWMIHRYSLDDQLNLIKAQPVVQGYIAKETVDGSVFVFRLNDSALFKFRAGKTTMFLDGFTRRDWGNWAIAENGIVAAMHREDGDRLVFQSFDGSGAQQLALLPAGHLMDQNSVAIHPVTGKIFLAYYAMQQADIFGLKRID